jgi:hypothetical protein
MDEPVPLPPPGDDRARRRGLFSGRAPATAQDALGSTDRGVEELMGAYQATIERQLEEGLQRIQLMASSLMHEIASEVWRTAGGDKDDMRGKILLELSRDQALRGLIAHSDERFQALAVRTARLEDTLNHVANSFRETRQELADRVGALGDAGTGQEIREFRGQLADVLRQVAAALATLAERDQAIVDTVRERVREHGELVSRETARISEAMEGYVQHGVEAVGQLASQMDAQLHTLNRRDEDIAERIERAVQEQMRLLGEQLQLINDRTTIDTSELGEAIGHQGGRTDERMRAVAEYLHLLNDRIDVSSREAIGEMRRALEVRVMGLAQLVRSDSEALRDELVRTTAAIDERTARTLDERLALASEAVNEATARMIDGLGGRLQEETSHAIRSWIDDALARLESQAAEQERRFDGRAEETLAALDRNMVRLTDVIAGQFERLGRSADERTEGVEQAVERAVEQRMSALARLIRSDNETLANQIVTDQEVSKQSLRAMKELQANLPAEVIEMVEQRFASLAESIERSNEVLAKRIDRMAEKLGERYDNDIQVVIDRMGDAMHALASLGRPGATAGAE